MVRLTLPLVSLSALLVVSDASFLRFGAFFERSAPEASSSGALVPPAVDSTGSEVEEGGRDLSGTSIKIMGNNGSPSSAFPLGLCEGDCDSDAECEGNLVCYQGSSGNGVPGCSGSDVKNLDYCVDPQALSNGAAAPADDDANNGDDNGDDGSDQGASGQSFAETAGPSLYKMHWEEWYYWQEERAERRWCIQALENRPGSRARIYDCDSGDASRLVFERQSTDEAFQVRVHGESICLQKPDTSEGYCSFETCDGSEAQKWTDRNGNAFGSGTFQFSPASQPNWCLTVTHHPRETEQLWVSECGYTEYWHTSLWAEYAIGS